MDNIRLFQQLIERGFNQGDLSVADEVCADTLTDHEYLAQGHLRGPEVFKTRIKHVRDSTQNLTMTIEDIAADGDKVWARLVERGNDPSSGQAFSFDIMVVCRFVDGRMVEHWGVPDRFALLHQLGRLPPPPG